MKRFLTTAALVLLPVIGWVLFLCFIADGKTDPYYLRFTTGKKSSLILGTSRAAQGLQPASFNSVLLPNSTPSFYNYSFSLLDSPFGPAYLESIKKKLDPETKDGVFIVTVDPWSISATGDDFDNLVKFPENKGFIGKTKFVNINPNIPYLLQSFDEPFINIWLKWRKPGFMYLHSDGWLEVNLKMDSTLFNISLTNKLKIYRDDYLPNYKFSKTRFEFLNKTISFLKEHGRVYLVRLPVHQDMFDIEDELMPDFDDKIKNIIASANVSYLNFKLLENSYHYTDGNHLYKTSGKEVSAKIAHWLIEQ